MAALSFSNKRRLMRVVEPSKRVNLGMETASIRLPKVITRGSNKWVAAHILLDKNMNRWFGKG